MTLDISQFIANTIRTQSKIHHLDINVKATKTSEIPQSVTSLIKKDYGDKYLDDAEYVAFFWGEIAKDDIEKLFNTVDKALGKSANKLTDKDFKKISLNLGDAEEVEVAAEEIDEPEDDDKEEDDNEAEIEIEDDEEDDNDEESLNEDDEEDNEEDDEEKVEVEVEEKKIPTAYFFLKITTK